MQHIDQLYEIIEKLCGTIDNQFEIIDKLYDINDKPYLNHW